MVSGRDERGVGSMVEGVYCGRNKSGRRVGRKKIEGKFYQLFMLLQILLCVM
jgi:hypothetical protein